MILSDTADSQIVSRLLRTSAGHHVARRYRRAVGWVIVILSFGMAGHALVGIVGLDVDVGDGVFTLLGTSLAVLVIALLVAGRGRGREARDGPRL